jgi:molecular chaperone DnaJ
VITLEVEPDRFYSREGNDLLATVPLNIAQATLGTKITVRTLDGRKVSLRIPPGTPSGKRFRVRGQGIAKDEERGDLIVLTSIVVRKSCRRSRKSRCASSRMPWASSSSRASEGRHPGHPGVSKRRAGIQCR